MVLSDMAVSERLAHCLEHEQDGLVVVTEMRVKS